MNKKGEGAVISDPSGLDDVGVYWNANARFRYQSLMQDYLELQKEAVSVKSKLEVSKQRKQILAAEVRFLRKRYKQLRKTKTVNLIVQPSKSQKRKTMKERKSCRKNSNLHRLPSIPEQNPKKKIYFRKEVALPTGSTAIDRYHKRVSHAGYEANRLDSLSVSDMNPKGRTSLQRETLTLNRTVFLDLNQKGRIQAANEQSSRNAVGISDLNQDSFLNGKESSLPRRSPVFDLNEISTEDEEFRIGNKEPVRFQETKKTLFSGINGERHNELKISICRDAGEGSTQARKRKISWLDPVALKV